MARWGLAVVLILGIGVLEARAQDLSDLNRRLDRINSDLDATLRRSEELLRKVKSASPPAPAPAPSYTPPPRSDLGKRLDEIQKRLDSQGAPLVAPGTLDKRLDEIEKRLAATQSPPPPPQQPTEIVIDLRRGGASGDGKAELERLKAAVYSLNSINVSSKQLLSVDAVLAKAFGGNGIPETGEAKVRIDVSSILTQDQIRLLRGALAEDPFSCAGDREITQGVGAASLASTIFNPALYYQLLGVSNDRAAFEKAVGVASEFGVAPENKDSSSSTQRLVIPPGESGVVHPEAARRLLLQQMTKGPAKGGILIRTEDSERHNAFRLDHDFVQRPGTSKGDAHEEIWELPNGMRAYTLRAINGNLQTAAPPSLVTARITNPVSCMSCHDTGFIATTGNGNARDADSLKSVALNFNEPGVRRELVKGLFRATPESYGKVIEQANDRFQKALESSGVMSPRRFASFLEKATAGEIRLDALAAELGAEPDEVAGALISDRSISNVVPVNSIRNAMAEYVRNNDPASLPSLPLTALARLVRVGIDGTSSVYCVLKGRLSRDSARLGVGHRALVRGGSRTGSGGDGLTTH